MQVEQMMHSIPFKTTKEQTILLSNSTAPHKSEVHEAMFPLAVVIKERRTPLLQFMN